MSALPHPTPKSTPTSALEQRVRHPATRLLLDQLLHDVDAQAKLRYSIQRLEHAVKIGADQHTYCWQTPDGRQADISVFYTVAEDVEIVAAQLIRIDYREPTVQERADYEDAFDAEMMSCGDLWLSVTSHLWEKQL